MAGHAYPFDLGRGAVLRSGPGDQRGMGARFTVSMQEHLLERLSAIPCGHGPRQLASLRKVIEKLLTPLWLSVAP